MSVETEFQEENFLRATKRSNQARIVAHTISAQLKDLIPAFKSGVTSVRAFGEQGWMNLTFLVEVAEPPAHYILRLAARGPNKQHTRSRSIPSYEKERLILECLEDSPFTPKVHADCTGVFAISIPGSGTVEFAYLIESYLPLASAKQLAESEQRGRILEQLGFIMRDIHRTPMQGFGLDIDESTQSFVHPTFESFMAHKLAAIERSPIASSMKDWLTSRVAAFVETNPSPCLFHRDLLGNWGNFLLDSTGSVRGIIDWEYAGSGPAFHFEIAALLYVLSRDGHSQERINHDLSAVLRGYGISYKTYLASYDRDVQTIVLLNSVSAILKFQEVQEKGTSASEPWRERFADRAQALCSTQYSSDRPRRVPYSKQH
jgi:aminoglycoside phosphotransferase (APT) family kinase protein